MWQTMATSRGRGAAEGAHPRRGALTPENAGKPTRRRRSSRLPCAMKSERAESPACGRTGTSQVTRCSWVPGEQPPGHGHERIVVLRDTDAQQYMAALARPPSHGREVVALLKATAGSAGESRNWTPSATWSTGPAPQYVLDHPPDAVLHRRLTDRTTTRPSNRGAGVPRRHQALTDGRAWTCSASVRTSAPACRWPNASRRTARAPGVQRAAEANPRGVLTPGSDRGKVRVDLMDLSDFTVSAGPRRPWRERYVDKDRQPPDQDLAPKA